MQEIKQASLPFTVKLNLLYRTLHCHRKNSGVYNQKSKKKKKINNEVECFFLLSEAT